MFLYILLLVFNKCFIANNNADKIIQVIKLGRKKTLCEKYPETI